MDSMTTRSAEERPLRSANRQRIARSVLWSSLAIHAPIALVAVIDARLKPQGDFDNYYTIGTTPGRPYVDFAVEFPLGTTQVFRMLAPMTGSRERFGDTMVILNVIADIAIVAALYWGWGIEAAACYALIVAPLADLFFLRTDLWSTAVATLAVAAWQRKRAALAAIGFVAGAAFKLWPLTFLPLLVVPSRGLNAWCHSLRLPRPGWQFSDCGSGSPDHSGLYQVLTFRGARGWHVESSVGGVWMLFDPSSIRHESGTLRIGTTSGPISIVLFAVGTVASLWMVWRGARTGHLGAGWAGGITRCWRSRRFSPRSRLLAGAGRRRGLGRTRQAHRRLDDTGGVFHEPRVQVVRPVVAGRTGCPSAPAGAQCAACRARARRGTARGPCGHGLSRDRTGHESCAASSASTTSSTLRASRSARGIRSPRATGRTT